MSETPDSEEESQSSSSSRNISLIEKRLTEENPDIFDGLRPEKRQQIIREVAYSIQKSHSGPLPDWESLAEYNKIIPNGADRIMKMSEKQSEHRMQLELIVVKGQIKQSNLGQIFAFIIGLAALAAATYCIIIGKEWSGVILGVGGLTGLVTAFIQGKKEQREELKEKNPKD